MHESLLTLAPMLDAVMAKGPAATATWLRRVRKHRKDLAVTLYALVKRRMPAAGHEAAALDGPTEANYMVNGQGFISFMEAVSFATTSGAAEVYGVREQRRVWRPASKARPKTRHVIVKPDGSETEFRRRKRER